MRIWLRVARHSATMPAAVLIAALDVWLALAARTHGFNLWPDLVTGLSAASLYTGTLAAGFAAFEASRWSTTTATRTASGTRSPVMVRLLHAAAVIAPLLAGYLVALLTLWIYAAITGTYGAPYVWWLFAFAGALIAAAAFGYAVGTVGPGRWYIAPVATLGFYGLFVLTRVGNPPFGIQSLYPVITTSDNVFVRHIGSTMIAQTVLFLAAAALLTIFAGGGWRASSQRMLAIVSGGLLLAVIAGASVTVSTNGQYTTGHNPRDFVCSSESSFTLCLNRGYRAAMTPLRQQFDAMTVRAAGTPLVPTRLEQNVEGIGDEPSHGARSVYVEQLGPDDMQFAVYRYVDKYGGAQRCTDPGAESYLANEYVDSWLSGFASMDENSPGYSHFRKLSALSGARGNAWFRANYPAYKSCQLLLKDLP